MEANLILGWSRKWIKGNSRFKTPIESAASCDVVFINILASLHCTEFCTSPGSNYKIDFGSPIPNLVGVAPIPSAFIIAGHAVLIRVGEPTRFLDCYKTQICISVNLRKTRPRQTKLANYQNTLVIQIGIVLSFIAYISNLDISNLCNLSFRYSPYPF